MTFDELYNKAKSVVYARELSENAEAGSVGAAILAETGKVYTGVCMIQHVLWVSVRNMRLPQQ